MRILFDSKLSQFKTPFGMLLPGQGCRLRVDIPVSCRTVKAEVIFLQDDALTEAFRAPLAKAEANALYEAWSGEVSLPAAGLYFYYFFITTQNEAFRLYKQGNDTNMEAGDLWQLSCVEERYPVPEALRGAVMYQIFPDRFYQSGVCDCAEKLRPYYVHESRDELPVYLPNEHGEMLNNDFFGGNLNGIREKLPYLHGLGVEILYLNPIFMAFSNHRYDTYDYKRVDPMLGTEADFTALCEAAHVLGMKIVLDGVFSHVGSRSPYFQSAISDPASPYRSWFRFLHYPDIYESWWGITTLPCVDKSNESYIRYIIEDEDSVLAHWLRLGADGFRLDVVDELPDAFVERLRRRLRELDPEAILIGEVWEDASNKIAYNVRRRYFTGRQLDSVMNYPWRNAIVAFLTDADDGTALGESLMTLAENYPPEVLSCVMNHLGTHDTPRILTVLGEPFCGTKDERAHRRMTPVQRKTALMRLRMAVFLQFTLPGMPCIYYGDEAGVEGFEDPFCRACYPWGREDEELQAYYRMMTALRGSSEALRRGGLRVLAAGNGRIAFSRAFGDERLIVCVNHSIGEWVLPAGRVRFAESAAPSPTGEVVLMRGGFCLLEPSDPEAHISIE